MFLAAGAKLDKYEVVAPLAVGGMAELYVARAVGIEGFEKLCVIKRILPQHARDEVFVKMFLDEARLAATLRHPNVIQVYDVGVVKGRYYFAMEYVHGQDLAAVVAAAREQRRGLRVGGAVAIAIGVAAGLHHAHEQRGREGDPLGIVHRDVSPSNILLSYDGHVKVVDFGIAKAAARATQTTAGGIKGKLCYMSPEQVHASRDLDRRSDVFSLGVVLYELTTGKPLFRADNDLLIAEKITSGAITPPGEARPGYDERLAAIVMKALARDPAARWQTAGELGRALEDYARTAQLATSSHALAELMSELFARQIREWAVARKRGESLADLVRHTAEVSAVSDPEAEVPASRTPLWRRPSAWVAAGAIGAAVAGWTIVLAGRAPPSDATPPPAPPPAAAPAAPTTRPAATPVTPAAADPPIDQLGATPLETIEPAPAEGSAAAAAEVRRRRRAKAARTPRVGAEGSAAPPATGSAGPTPLDQVTNPFRTAP